MGMTDLDALPTDDCLDALVTQLIACGGPLSQMISHMHEAEASGLCSPDAPPIFEAAHKLIRDVVDDLSERHTEDEIRTSAEIVEEVTNAICENIFFVPPSEMRRMTRGRGSARRANRQQRRSRRRQR
jgi:hypothetical protein